MKRTFVAALILLVALAASAKAARASHGNIGIGFQVGEPSGLTAKFWLGGQSAIDLTVGWNLFANSFTVQAGYLFHFPLPVTAGSLAAYVGLGGIVGGGTYRPDHPNEPYIFLAGRIPLGLEYIYNPISFYAEVDPLILLLPATTFSIGGGLGFRFYF